MSKLTHPVYAMLTADAWIQVNKSLRWSLGNDEAVIYAELIAANIYFEKRSELTEDEYFFNTIEDLYLKTHIEKRAQRSAITKLKNAGLIDMVVQGLPPVRYFKIHNDPELLIRYLQKGKELIENVRKATEINKKDKTALFKGTESSSNKYINYSRKKKWLNVVPEHRPDELELIVTDSCP